MRLFSPRRSVSTPSFVLLFYSCYLYLNVVIAAANKKCSYGEPLKHSSGVDLCCGRCRDSFIKCPATYQCVLDRLERWHPVCCRDQLPGYAVAYCNHGRGDLYLNGEFRDHLQPDNATIYPLHGAFNLQRVNIECCFLGSVSEPHGLIFSSPNLYTDSNWLCKDSKRYSNVSFSNSSSPSAYVIERNFGEDFAGYLFQYDPVFDSGANWIWLKGLNSNYDPQCVACMNTKFDSNIPKDLVDSYSTKRILSHHSRIYLYGFYREFRFAFELRIGNFISYPAARVMFMPCHKSEDETYLALEFGVHDSRSLQMQICSRRKYRREVICETTAYMSHKQNTDLLPCETFARFSLSIFKNGSIELRSDEQVHSAGMSLLLWHGPWQESCTTITHLNMTSSSSSATNQSYIRYYRSTDVNRCLFVERELEQLTPCGNGYIVNEEQCLKCGCCFFPPHLIHSVLTMLPACYTPLGLYPVVKVVLGSSGNSREEFYWNACVSIGNARKEIQETKLDYSKLGSSKAYKRVHGRVLPANCSRPFAEIIGDYQLHVKPFPVAKLDECVTFVIALENTVRYIRIKLSFGDGSFKDNLVVRQGVDIPAWVSSEIKPSYFVGTITHFFQTSFEQTIKLDIFGRNSDNISLSKSLWVTPVGQMALINLMILAPADIVKPCAEQGYTFALIQSIDSLNFSISLSFGSEIIEHNSSLMKSITEVPVWLALNINSRDKVHILYRHFPECQDYSVVFQMIHKASQTDLSTAKVLELSQYNTKKTAIDTGVTISPSSSDYTTGDLVVLTATEENFDGQLEEKRQVLWHCTMNASWSWPEVLSLEVEVTSNKDEACFDKDDLFIYESDYGSQFSAMFVLPANRFFITNLSRTYQFHVLVRTQDGILRTGYYPLTVTPVIPLTVSIICIANCEKVLRVDEALVLSYKCVSCRKQETIQIQWTLYPERLTNAIGSIAWPAKRSSTDGDVLVVHGRLFLLITEEENYFVQLVAKRMDNSSTSQIYKFTVKKSSGRTEPLKSAHQINEEKILTHHADYWLYLAIPFALLLGLIAALMLVYYKGRPPDDTKAEEPPDAPSGPPPTSASMPGLEQHLKEVSLHTATGEQLSVARRSIAPLDLNQKQSNKS